MAYQKALMLNVPYELFSGTVSPVVATSVAMPARRVQLTIQSIPVNGSASALKIQGSDDNVTFNDIASAVMNTATGDIIDVQTSAAFIKLAGTFTADSLSVMCVAKAA